MALCTECIIRWLPQALQSGRMTWDRLHPRIKAIMVRNGYGKDGKKIVTVLK